MRIANFLPETDVEGPGTRSAVWVQGCSIRCPRCCNPLFIPFEGGTETDPRLLAKEIATLPVEGVTILGGEPLDQAAEMKTLLTELRSNSDKGLILFTGHPWEEVQKNEEWYELVQICDILKAGPFVHSLVPDSRRWIGSRNQTVHYFTDRYKTLQTCWPPAKKVIEIHFRGDEIQVNGTPLDKALFPIVTENQIRGERQ